MRSKPTIQAERLRVFAFIKRYRVQSAGRDPSPVEVAHALNLDRHTARHHMLALDGASGLGPIARPRRLQRYEESVREDWAMGLIPVDQHFASQGAK